LRILLFYHCSKLLFSTAVLQQLSRKTEFL